MAAKPNASFIERYQRDTGEIIDLFTDEEISFPECTFRLGAAFISLLDKVSIEELRSVREVMVANNAMVMEELAKRAKEQSKVVTVH